MSYDWYKPQDDNKNEYDWYTPPQKEPPKPSTWDNVKNTASKVGNFIAEPFKAIPLLPSKEGINALKKADITSNPIANTQLGRDLRAGVADTSNPVYRGLQSVGLDKVPGINKVLDYAVKVTEQEQARGGTSIPSQLTRFVPGAIQNTALEIGRASCRERV